MNDNTLPTSTLRTMGVVIVLLFDLALRKGREVVEKVKPLVEPPDEIRISSRSGTLYTGVLVLDRNEVQAGIVVATGFDPLGASQARAPTPTIGRAADPTPRRDTGAGLRHWSEDRSIYDEDDEGGLSWRR
jgi:hypothetical protein